MSGASRLIPDEARRANVCGNHQVAGRDQFDDAGIRRVETRRQLN